MRRSLLILFLGLSACAEYDLATAEDSNELSGGEYDTGAGDDADSDGLRLDVYPSGGGLSLEPQSKSLDTVDSQGVVELDRTITVTGRVQGFAAHPAIDAEIPGEGGVPVSAVVRATVPGLITGAAAYTDSDGRFELTLPAASDYTFSVVPEDENLPVYVEALRTFTDGEDFVIDLEYGVPVYGLVRQEDGSTVGMDATVRILDPDTGVAGPRIDVETDGHYMLRSAPGSWLVELEGSQGDWLPNQIQSVTVEEEVGARLDFSVGTLTEYAVFGEVQGPSGNPVDGATVRLTALELTEATGRLVIEKVSANGGEWAQRLLPGTWQAEYIPPYDPDSALSPTSVEFTVTGNTELEAVALPAKVSVTIDVVDPRNSPLPFVVVSARERGFENYLYTGSTDESGSLTLELPPVPLDIRLTPPTAEWAITHYSLNDPGSVAGSDLELSLSQGELVEGILEVDGEPVPYAYIEVMNETDDLYGTALSDENGAFSIRIDPN